MVHQNMGLLRVQNDTDNRHVAAGWHRKGSTAITLTAPQCAESSQMRVINDKRSYTSRAFGYQNVDGLFSSNVIIHYVLPYLRSIF